MLFYIDFKPSQMVYLLDHEDQRVIIRMVDFGAITTKQGGLLAMTYHYCPPEVSRGGGCGRAGAGGGGFT